MWVRSDNDLFLSSYSAKNEEYLDRYNKYMDLIHVESEDESRARIASAVAYFACEIEAKMLPRGRRDKSVAMSDYLSGATITVDLPRHYLMRGAIPGTDERSLRNTLTRNGFNCHRVSLVPKRGRHFRSGLPFVKLTFQVH